MCSFDQFSGTFVFASYRDPNLERTLEVYRNTANYLKTLELDEEELTRAIIGTIGVLDAYRLPDSKGFSDSLRFLIGYSDEERQRLREEVLATSVDDFRAFGAVLEKAFASSSVEVICTPERAQKAGIEKVLKVL